MKKVLVAMSGGVDSTVCAYMLKNRGYLVEGVYLKLHDNPDYHKKNISKVQKAAQFLDIKYHVLDLSEKFNQKVYEPFIKTYEDGFTPNPCVLCNRNIKLGALIDFSKKMGFDNLATGHYAIVRDGFIYEATDKSKDQSYFLSNVKKEALDYIMFPLGEMYKKDVKEIAKNSNFLKSFAEQKESSEICFVEDSYIDVLKKHIDIDQKGDVLDTNGNIIGEHKGYMHYTIGKRKGFKIFKAHTPHYVIKIDPKHNTIIVGNKEDLNIRSFLVEDLNMFVSNKDLDVDVKIRYRSSKTPCQVKIKENKAIVTLYENIQGLAPGQAAVFYDKNRVIGSGWIRGEIDEL